MWTISDCVNGRVTDLSPWHNYLWHADDFWEGGQLDWILAYPSPLQVMPALAFPPWSVTWPWHHVQSFYGASEPWWSLVHCAAGISWMQWMGKSHVCRTCGHDTEAPIKCDLGTWSEWVNQPQYHHGHKETSWERPSQRNWDVQNQEIPPRYCQIL